jgi:hypothetical protein
MVVVQEEEEEEKEEKEYLRRSMPGVLSCLGCEYILKSEPCHCDTTHANRPRNGTNAPVPLPGSAAEAYSHNLIDLMESFRILVPLGTERSEALKSRGWGLLKTSRNLIGLRLQGVKDHAGSRNRHRRKRQRGKRQSLTLLDLPLCRREVFKSANWLVF